MICEAAVPQVEYSQSGAFRIGRSFSSSSPLGNTRTGTYFGTAQKRIYDNGSIQSKIGAIFSQGLPLGITGLFNENPGLIVTVNGSTSKLDRSIISITQQKVSQEETVAEISFKQKLENIQENLGISITQIAQLFGVTRKSVYDWIDGSAPRSNIANRMEIISSVIDSSAQKYNLKKLKGVWLTPVAGSSFIDILSDDKLDVSARIEAAAATLEELAPRLGQESPKQSKTYLGNAHSSDIDRVVDLG